MVKQAQSLILTLWWWARPALRAAAEVAWLVVKALWSMIRPLLSFVLQVAAALILIFEEWGWKPLSDALARLARFKPWAMLETWIASLPPYPALLVFALPTTILLPLKFMSIWLLANGFYLTAGALFIAAKIASTALVARIFILTRPALMRIGWFARAYNKFMPWKDALFARIRASYTWRYGRMLKTAIRHESRQAWARWKPMLKEATAAWRPRAATLLREMRLTLKQTWETWRPQLIASLSNLRSGARRTWQRLIGVG